MKHLTQTRKKKDSVGDFLRFWRKHNRMSQMALALEVGISTRHLSFVETGRSRPSRNLVLKMARSLKLPLRHCNAFLKAAGYAAEFKEERFNGDRMEMVREALQRMLEKHEPYPAFVVSPAYTVLMSNSGYKRMVTFLAGEQALTRYDNVYRLTFSSDGLRPAIDDWPRIERFMLNRLWDEAVSTQNSDLFSLYEEISRLQAGTIPPVDSGLDATFPVMRLTFVKNDIKASFFTTITTFGTPLDLTTQELRIESLFPADAFTKGLFER